MNKKQIQQNVKTGYAEILKRNTKASLLPSFLRCCDPTDVAADIGRKIGYSDEELDAVPAEANLGIGCGNPTALASMQRGETVLDLGSGAGFDCFLAAQATGTTGQVIGVDITPEMIAQATKNAKTGGYENVIFKQGVIEDLPIDSCSVDLIISNCVINLSTEKELVFKEAYRVAKPGGRIMISDIILLKDLPSFVKDSVELHIACIAGAIRKEDYMEAMAKAGFQDIRVDKQTSFPVELMLNDPIAKQIVQEHDLSPEEVKAIAASIASVSISAKKG